jgi:hypothetical protein
VERVLFIHLTNGWQWKCSRAREDLRGCPGRYTASFVRILSLRTWAIRHKNVKAPGIYRSLSFSDDLGQAHECRSAQVTSPIPPAQVVPSPAIAASFHEFHARLRVSPLFFPNHSDVGLYPIRLSNPVVTLTHSQAQQHW